MGVNSGEEDGIRGGTRMTPIGYFPEALERSLIATFSSPLAKMRVPVRTVLVEFTGVCTWCCGKPSGLLCSLRGVGNENSDRTLSKDILGKREVNSSTSGDDLESGKINTGSLVR